MSDQSSVNPPDSPPASPVIPEGLATKLGKYGALLAIVIGVLAEVFDVEVNAETFAAFGGSVLLLATTMAGRFAQAYALYRDAPFQAIGDLFDAGGFDEFEDYVETEVPSESVLKSTFPEDPPEDPAPRASNS